MPTASELLVVEDGTMPTDPVANSYATVAMGNDFAATRLYADAWNQANDDTKAQALMMASSLIDANTEYEGRKRTFNQGLEWPRAFVPNYGILTAADFPSYFLTLTGMGSYFGNYLPWNYIPPQIMAATCQMAFELLARNRTKEDPTKGIKSFNIGQGALQFTFDSTDRIRVIPDTVSVYLVQLGSLRGAAGGMNKRVVRV